MFCIGSPKNVLQAGAIFFVTLQINILQMVQKSFSIYNSELTDCSLFIETGNEYIACWCNNAAGSMEAFELFDFDAVTAATDFNELYKNVKLYSRLLTSGFSKVHCIWGHAQCTFIPETVYTRSSLAEYGYLLFGVQQPHTLLVEKIKDMVVLSTIPQIARMEYDEHFEVDSHSHAYMGILTRLGITGTGIQVFFYKSNVLVLAVKNSQLLLMQQFAYQTPDDVLYNILNVCATQNLPLETTQITAAGFITTDSSMYEKLYAYLPKLSIAVVPENRFSSAEFLAYPLHYFASFC